MKNAVRIISLIMVVVFVGAALVACSNISQSYADKINKAAENDEHITYTQVLEDLGENAVDVTIAKTGVIYAVEGCKSLDDIEDKIDAGETVKGIVITVFNGKATSAKFQEISEDDF